MSRIISSTEAIFGNLVLKMEDHRYLPALRSHPFKRSQGYARSGLSGSRRAVGHERVRGLGRLEKGRSYGVVFRVYRSRPGTPRESTDCAIAELLCGYGKVTVCVVSKAPSEQVPDTVRICEPLGGALNCSLHDLLAPGRIEPRTNGNGDKVSTSSTFDDVTVTL